MGLVKIINNAIDNLEESYTSSETPSIDLLQDIFKVGFIGTTAAAFGGAISNCPEVTEYAIGGMIGSYAFASITEAGKSLYHKFVLN